MVVEAQNFMASTYTNLSCYVPSIPKRSSTPNFSSSLYPSNTCGYSGISRHKAISSSRTHAKFEKFQGQENLEEFTELSSLDPEPIQEEEEREEDDRFVFQLIIHLIWYLCCIKFIIELKVVYLKNKSTIDDGTFHPLVDSCS